MNLVTLENISKQFSDRILLNGVNLLINEGDRIGLIGRNGSGKTTLLRIVAGAEPMDNGLRTVWGGVRMTYLSQQPELDGRLTVLDTVFRSEAPQLKLLHEYQQASLQLEQNPHHPPAQTLLAKLTAEMDRTGSWSAEAEAKTILTRLGITQFDAKVETLSGGQQKRVALAHALINPADLLILDEPTNHIDVEAIAWLEALLATRRKSLLMVTHDRYFLDRVVTRIVELDRRELVSYAGNYGRYLEQSARRHEQLATAEAKQQARLRRELEWLRRGAMARSTKQKARKQRIAELQELHYDRGERRVAMALASRRLGKRVLEARELGKSYGDLTLFAGLDFTLNPGDRIGILGPNGSGKTTFLDILAGKIGPDTGLVNWGETVHLGYFDQMSQELPPEKRVIEFIEGMAPLIATKDGGRVTAAQMLEWFLFSRREQQTRIQSLSGGERRRLYLLRTLIHQPNVLFLDEPTNDLDIQTLGVLEQFLDHFKGCLVVVSHDRYFLDRNVDFLMSFEPGLVGLRFPGPYASYRQRRDVLTAVSPAPLSTKPAIKKRPSPAKPRRLTWKEKQELAALETQIGELEAAKALLEAEINNIGGDYGRLSKLTEKLAQSQTASGVAEERWLALMEISENNQ